MGDEESLSLVYNQGRYMITKDVFNIENIKIAIIFGGGRGIGLALTQKLLNSYPDLKVFSTYRAERRATELLDLAKDYPQRLKVIQLDPLNEEDLGRFSKFFRDSETDIDLIINSIGFLGNQEIKPEKCLDDINCKNLLEYYAVNSIVAPLIAKHFYTFFSKKMLSCFINLSAKVGSIEDNKMGGWYGYRSSKSAQNMMIKNISLELTRKKIRNIIISLHPGTTITDLSKPYIKNTNYNLHMPLDTALNIINIINSLEISQSGNFLSWDGSIIPW